MKTLVLGIGNLLLGDEGVGVHAAHALAAETFPENVTVVDAGTAILDALPFIESADRVIVIDAVRAGEPPGTLYRFPLEDSAPSAVIGSMHGFDLSRLMALACRADVPETVVLGVEPAVIQWSMELSPEVAQVLPELLRWVKREVSAPPG